MLLDAMAASCTVAGVVVAAGVLGRSRDLRQAVGVLLDFLLAAGLLRLSLSDATWTSLATVSLVVVVRKTVVVAGLGRRAARRAPVSHGATRIPPAR